MKLDDIKSAIRRTTAVTALNPMQTAVAASDAARIVLLSPTGSGKTIAFAIALLRRINMQRINRTGPEAVVIAPTRELVRQIFDVVRPLATVFGIKTLSMYGGNPFAAEEASIRGDMPGIVIATPGRLLDHLNRATLDVAHTADVVLDEYDKTLELGFCDEMKRIARRLGSALPGSQPRFVMVTSATRLAEVPGFVDIAKAEIIDYTQQTPVQSRLRIVNVPSPDRDKIEILAALIRSIPDGPVMVFVNHRESADRVGHELERRHISAVVYHGGLDQQHREMALAKFDSRGARVMVSTDLAGRGIDIDNVRAVIHYHPAADQSIWTHRNGRTARVDRTGEVYVITGPDESIPDFVVTQNDYYPDMSAAGDVPAPMQVIYFDRGKRDKLSRGDIAGFVMKQCGVPAASVGKITLGNAYSLVAVEPAYSAAVLDGVRNNRIKNTRARATLL